MGFIKEPGKGLMLGMEVGARNVYKLCAGKELDDITEALGWAIGGPGLLRVELLSLPRWQLFAHEWSIEYPDPTDPIGTVESHVQGSKT